MEQLWDRLAREGASKAPAQPNACPSLAAFLARGFDALRRDLQAAECGRHVPSGRAPGGSTRHDREQIQKHRKF